MTRPRQRVTIVTDLQYGSTGKGLLCGYLARRDPAITAAVTAWAPNAGHTFIDAMGRKFVHRQLANSIASPAVREIFLGPGSVIDVVTLAAEIESCRDLIKRGVRIYAHANAAVLRDRHVVEEQALLRIGSTQKGASAAVIDKMRRDVSSAILAETLSIELDDIGVTVLDPERYSHELMQHAEILVEGHQGFSLSVHHGMWPYTTSRDTSTSAILADCAVAFPLETSVWGVLRTFPIRVANRYDDDGKMIGFSGPCYDDQLETTWQALGQKPELTTVTQRVRRVFTYSTRQIAHATSINGVDHVFVNFMNYLPPGERWGFIQRVAFDTHVLPPDMLFGYGPTETDVREFNDEEAW